MLYPTAAWTGPDALQRSLPVRYRFDWLGSPVVAGTAPGTRLDAELSYGLGVPGGQGVVSPYGGVSLQGAGERTWRLGGRMQVQPALTVSLEGARRDHPGSAAEHTLTLNGTLRW